MLGRCKEQLWLKMEVAAPGQSATNNAAGGELAEVGLRGRICSKTFQKTITT